MTDTTNGKAIADDLRALIERATPALLAMSDAETAHPRAVGKWSPKEIVGHMIDSAANNHQRFVRAQITDDFPFQRYQQNEWVAIQHYADASWTGLVELWRTYNRHLAHVIEVTPEAVRMRSRVRRDIVEDGWKIVANAEPTTLDFFMRDYVVHVNHHLAQILG